MRVLHVLESLSPGGVETTFLNVLRHLSPSMTHDVLAFAGGALEPEYRQAAHRVFVAHRADDLERLVVGGNYDAAYILFERCADRLLPMLLTRTATAVIYGKNYDFSGQWRSTEGFTWVPDDAMLAASDAVTFTTDALASAYASADRARGHVLGKGADITPLMTIAPPAADTRNRILAIANPNPRKRLGDLVSALALVRRAVPDAEVRVIGGGDATEERRLRLLALQQGLAGAFVLAGVSRDIPSELREARIVALPSGNEGVPTALLEAMAAGRPVVTTDAGHVRSIVADGQEGFVVPIGDVSGMADRIVDLLSDRALAEAMGRRGRERAQRHGVEAIASRLSAILASQAAC